MTIFHKENAARLRRQNKKSLCILGLSLAGAALVCALCLCFVQKAGRLPCQLLATAATAFAGCVSLVQADSIRHRGRRIALCEKQPGAPCFGQVCRVEPYTTTIEKLSFYSMEISLDGKPKTYFLYHETDPAPFLGKTVTFTACDHILFSLEVQ